tara:strand:+ start:385 stop:498 length:114 start_codon:yes stop_codon:yes gene_type:complete
MNGKSVEPKDISIKNNKDNKKIKINRKKMFLVTKYFI